MGQEDFEVWWKGEWLNGDEMKNYIFNTGAVAKRIKKERKLLGFEATKTHKNFLWKNL